ncbi:MAG: PfkB family carbohydrate kinase [Chloroflexi bacterium]|nr:PfkB family carbohydrate kinase [Chloroflexota bacterium]
MTVDFLIIGHMTHDRTPDGFRLGGTVSYAAVTARRLGRQPAILTRAALNGLLTTAAEPDSPANVVALPGSPLAGVSIHVLPSPVSTTFVNIYRDGQRTQVIEALAEPISPGNLPPAWAQVPVVLLGPLVREVPPAWVNAFPASLVGVTPQGWMRQWDATGRVRPARWENAAEFLRRADVVILSREDVGSDETYLAALAAQARLMVVTDGWRGATLYHDGEHYHVPPRPTREVDPTGAGDVFAAAFMIRLAETRDPVVATRFANVVASMSVEAPGMDAIPYREQVDEWLERVA